MRAYKTSEAAPDHHLARCAPAVGLTHSNNYYISQFSTFLLHITHFLLAVKTTRQFCYFKIYFKDKGLILREGFLNHTTSDSQKSNTPIIIIIVEKMKPGKSLTAENMNRNLANIDYAVRGRIARRAEEIDAEIRKVTMY